MSCRLDARALCAITEFRYDPGMWMGPTSMKVNSSGFRFPTASLLELAKGPIPCCQCRSLFKRRYICHCNSPNIAPWLDSTCKMHARSCDHLRARAASGTAICVATPQVHSPVTYLTTW